MDGTRAPAGECPVIVSSTGGRGGGAVTGAGQGRPGPGRLQARLHLIDNSFPRGSARPGPAGSGQTCTVRVRRGARLGGPRAESQAGLSCPVAARSE